MTSNTQNMNGVNVIPIVNEHRLDSQLLTVGGSGTGERDGGSGEYGTDLHCPPQPFLTPESIARGDDIVYTRKG